MNTMSTMVAMSTNSGTSTNSAYECYEYDGGHESKEREKERETP